MRALMAFATVTSLLAGCSNQASEGQGGRLSVSVAALQLTGVTNVCYSLAVRNDANDLVWQRSQICGAEFGTAGDITYIGTCDATDVNGGGATHTVTLTIDDVYGGATPLDDFIDPCAAPHNPNGCVQTVLCNENADTPVTFNLTLMRQANQGFFDIAVNFEDIFCSAKLDCESTSGAPLELLFHPVTGARSTTIVLGLACTAGPGASGSTALYRDPVVIECDGPGGSRVETRLPVNVSPGNTWKFDGGIPTDPAPGDAVWQYATYQGTEQLQCGSTSCRKLYWNVAIGFDPSFDNCRLETRMSASEAGAFYGLATPRETLYPYIDVSVDLTNASELICSRHPLNGSPGGVETRYSASNTPIGFGAAYTPTPYDECANDNDNCSKLASCTDTATGFSCACKTGTEGDGLSCERNITVYGQPDFHSTTNYGQLLASVDSFNFPWAVARIGRYLYVSDSSNNRIVIHQDSLQSTPIAVLGQPDFTSVLYNNDGTDTRSPTARGLRSPRGIATIDGKLVVADSNNHRVLIWNTAPTRNHQPADVVLGQPDFSSVAINRGASPDTAAAANSMRLPSDVAFHGGKFFVADTSNNRVLVWNAMPTSNGAPADFVLGQTAMTSSSANQGGTSPTALTLSGPAGLATDGPRLFVSDSTNHRVLVWSGAIASGSAPSMVIGQADFTTGTFATTATGLRTPRRVLPLDGALFIPEASNHRIAYYASVPISNGATATAHIGQANATSGSSNRGGTPTASSLNAPNSLFGDGASLYVVDGSNHRVLTIPAAGPFGPTTAALSVRGQPSMSANGTNSRTRPSHMGITTIGALCAYGNYLIAGEMDVDRFLVFDRNNIEDGAIAVIGQPDFTTGEVDANGNGVSDCSENPSYPVTRNRLCLHNSRTGCAVDGLGRLYISDNKNSRVLGWNAIPTTNDVQPDFVIGQTNFTSRATSCSASNFSEPGMLTVVGDRLVVPDYTHNRTLVFDISSPTTPPTSATTVIGQPDKTTCTATTTATGAGLSSAAAWDGTYLYISEYLNNRIMVYTGLPTSDGVAATYVLGQTDFTSRWTTSSPLADAPSANRFAYSGVSGPGTGGMWNPVAVVGNDIYVADGHQNYRILVFDKSSLANGMSAYKVLGQPNATTRRRASGNPTNAGNTNNTAFDELINVGGVFSFNDGYVWIMDSMRLFRAKSSRLLNYANNP